MNGKFALLALGLAAGLGGCASMSEEECLTVDWHEQGMREAVNGTPRSNFIKDREACAKIGVEADETQYMAGYAAGIAMFCTPENGLRWGREGRTYAQTCPVQQSLAFEANYRAGYSVYQAEEAIVALHAEQDRLESQLDKAGDDKERQRLRRELRRLDERLRDARTDLIRMERRLSGSQAS
ncbi:DUF2799 domain-containing protein [Kerstersia similis]|uniref:DUF2799 domain-containing protein n=1 Tax=Kerstersia similis TaxID=206505 RepID=UPI0039EE4D94